MVNSYLRVTFPQTDNLKYNNPGTWRCLNFKNCDFWQPARSISRVNLSSNHFAMFFESKRCQPDGKFVFVSTPGLTSSIKRFQKPQSVQSMMIGENQNYTHRPVSTTQKCPTHYERAIKGIEAKTTYEVEWSDDSLSSNWYDDPPDA